MCYNPFFYVQSKAPRLMQSAFSTLGDLYLYKLSDALYGEVGLYPFYAPYWVIFFISFNLYLHFIVRIASLTFWELFYQMANWFMFFCMNRTFSNCLETVLTIMGLYYYRSFQGLSSQSEVRFGHSGPSTCRKTNKCNHMVITYTLGPLS